MSATPHTPVPQSLDGPLPMTLPRLAEKKRLGEPIVMVTAYDYPSAQVAQEAGVDMVLVGDSGAMTVLGYPSTVPVSTEEMLMLAAAVRRGLRTPLLVGDLPFGSYEASDEQAIATAQRFIKEAGCDAVKLERGGTSVQRARAIVEAGIPVMGHVGLTPQTATALGGYRAQGRTADQALARRPRRARAAGGRLLLGRARGDPGGGHRGADAAAGDPGDRDRRRRRRPTARCWCSTTCSGSTTATRRASPSATRMCAPTWWPASRSTPTRCAAGSFPAPEHFYSIDERARALPGGFRPRRATQRLAGPVAATSSRVRAR